jgi:hypothetical protein
MLTGSRTGRDFRFRLSLLKTNGTGSGRMGVTRIPTASSFPTLMLRSMSRVEAQISIMVEMSGLIKGFPPEISITLERGWLISGTSRVTLIVGMSNTRIMTGVMGVDIRSSSIHYHSRREQHTWKRK